MTLLSRRIAAASLVLVLPLAAVAGSSWTSMTAPIR